MNEGWATYWHSTIMTRHGIEPADLICYADHCAGTLAGSHDAAESLQAGHRAVSATSKTAGTAAASARSTTTATTTQPSGDWNTKPAWGAQKIFEVRRIHNDLTFIDEFLTLDFCRQHKLFSFGYNEDSGYYEIESREFEESSSACCST